MIQIFKSFLLVFIAIFTIIKANSEPNVFKKVLKNGLTVLVRKNAVIPNVTIQLYYHVGSKDEQNDEKGLAHLLEHMVFKGTKEMLSETDIQAITQKLSGYCNAHTYYDWTSYEFELPSRHWHEALPILADCMSNCTFKQDLLNAEFKAVIQELKMGRDQYTQILFGELISAIFPDHPYHYPVIGFKQNIWQINSEKLMKFYKKHYKPNNATLVIVGDINPIEAFEKAEKCFEGILQDTNYKKNEYYYNRDIISHSITLYRDIKNPITVLAFVIPGTKKNNSFVLDATCNILGGGASSRLNQKLVEESKLVNSIGSLNWQIFDHGLFIFYFEPKNTQDNEEIISIIKDEIIKLQEKGISETEIKKIVNGLKYSYFKLKENNSVQAASIGELFLATQDENAVFKYFDYDLTTLQNQIKETITTYLRPCLMHRGFLLPAPENEKNNLLSMQQLNDEEDAAVLKTRIRKSEVEAENYVHKIISQPNNKYNFPKPDVFTLSNGIKVLSYNNTNTPTVSLHLNLKINQEYDLSEKPGTLNLLTASMPKGTKNKNYKELTEELESHAISLNLSSSGNISIETLSAELEKGLSILMEILTEPSLNEDEIEKERDLILNNIKSYWDNPHSIANNILYTNIYKNHPYSKEYLITEEHIKKITKDDLVKFYKKYFSPQGAKIAVSGDLSQIDIKSILDNTIAKWQGPDIEDIKYPTLEKIKPETIDHFINRDQIVLYFASPSINRFSADFDKLIIFNQILSGSMDSKLFRLREKTGYFYSINGSSTSNCNKQPGMFVISTTVSKENLIAAQELILKTIKEVSDNITEEEVKQAKDKIVSALIFNYKNNSAITSTLLFIEDYGYGFDYFDTRAKSIESITLEDVKDAIKRNIDINSLLKIRVGRI